MQLSIITPEKILFSADIQMVTIPGTEGDFGVLEGHAPFISTIRPGIITIEAQGSEKKRLTIFSGIAEVVPERCTILAETAEDCSSVSASDAQNRVDAAKKELDDAITDAARKNAEKKLALAQALVAAL